MSKVNCENIHCKKGWVEFLEDDKECWPVKRQKCAFCDGTGLHEGIRFLGAMADAMNACEASGDLTNFGIEMTKRITFVDGKMIFLDVPEGQ